MKRNSTSKRLSSRSAILGGKTPLRRAPAGLNWNTVLGTSWICEKARMFVSASMVSCSGARPIRGKSMDSPSAQIWISPGSSTTHLTMQWDFGVSTQRVLYVIKILWTSTIWAWIANRPLSSVARRMNYATPWERDSRAPSPLKNPDGISTTRAFGSSGPLARRTLRLGPSQRKPGTASQQRF